eukprot:gnl/MRDRNA2_/MRDRNA2_68101_c0_seq1.p1 gnl/MRDRNA2_/MRDRNA2_68101_c0~~gnl/MRDRNA2_/MRDRNA2_68101_c0_seq1.p1  ORF type:complete len:734 (+),score=99.01 gnl/MRDRNA2_/MRDRNA2_68101_c0_seq1:63-2264(+)
MKPEDELLETDLHSPSNVSVSPTFVTSSYSLAPEPNAFDRSFQRFIIRPDANLKKFWNGVFAILLLYTLTLFPFKLCFMSFKILEDPKDKAPDDTPEWKALAMIVDVLFWIDLVINFFSAYEADKGKVIDRPSKVVKNYLQGFFILDFIACLPPELFGAIVKMAYKDDVSRSEQAGKTLRILRVGRLTRLTRLTRLVRLSRLLKVVQVVNKYHFLKQIHKSRGGRILRLIVSLAFILHVLACGWYLMAALEDDPAVTWVARRDDTLEGFLYASPTLQWLHAVYLVFTIFTTVGFGDIYAVSEAEILYALGTMLIGAVAHSIFVSEMINVVTAVDEADCDYDKRKELFRAFCKHAGISKRNEKEMKRHAFHLRDAMFGFDRMQMHQLISTNFFARDTTEGLACDAFNGQLRKNMFFNCLVRTKGDFSMDPRPVLLVATYITQRHLVKKELIFRRGDYPVGIFFINRGVCAIVDHVGPKWHAIGEDDPSPLKNTEPVKKPLTLAFLTETSELDGNERAVLSAESIGMYPYRLFGCRSYFGDYEIIHERVRMVTARCETKDADVYLLPTKGFQEIAQEFPRFSENMKRSALRREVSRSMQERRFRTRKAAIPCKTLAVLTVQRQFRTWRAKKGSVRGAQSAGGLKKGGTQSLADTVLYTEDTIDRDDPVQLSGRSKFSNAVDHQEGHSLDDTLTTSRHTLDPIDDISSQTVKAIDAKKLESLEKRIDERLHGTVPA